MAPGRVRRSAIRRDLVRDRVASTAVVLAVTLAVAVFATFVGSGFMVRSDLDGAYQRSLPGDVVVATDRPLPAPLLERIVAIDGVDAADAGDRLRLRVRVADGISAWTDFDLRVVREVGQEAVGRTLVVDGAQPGPREVLVDRTALAELGAEVGDALEVQRPDGTTVTLRIAGRSAEAGRAAWFDPPAFGITTFAALEGLGLTSGPTSLLVRTARATLFGAPVIEAVRAAIQDAGFEVQRVDMLGSSDRAPADRTLETIYVVLAVLGSLALVATGLLVANEVGTLVVTHRRRIGVLRAIGADVSQVRAWYLAHVALLAAIGTGIGAVAGGIGARLMSGYVDGLVNVDPSAVVPPAWIVVVGVVLGLGVAVASAIRPLNGALSGSVRTALDDHGLAIGTARRGLGSAGASRATGALRALAVRNLLRRPGRSMLTLASLAVSGAMVIGTLDAQAAIADALGATARFRTDDVAVDIVRRPGASTGGAQAVEGTVDRLRSSRGIRAAEWWRIDLARLDDPIFGGLPGLPGPDGPDGGPPLFGVNVIGIPSGSAMLRPTLVGGGWLDGDPGHAVVSATFLDSIDGAAVGSSLRLILGDVRLDLVIAGVMAEPVGERLVIVDRGRLDDVPPSPDGRSRILVIGDGTLSDAELATTTVEALPVDGSVVDRIETRDGRAADQASDARGAAILGAFMIGSAAIVGAIGSIGLIAMLAGNVAERRRELAILRAVGAAPRQVVRLLLAESMLLSAASAALAVVLAVPLALLLGTLLGDAFLDRPLGFVPSWTARIAWVVVASVGALIATVVPARRAARVSLRDALAYE